MKTVEEMWQEVGPLISIEEPSYTPAMTLAVLERLIGNGYRVTFDAQGVAVRRFDTGDLAVFIESRVFWEALLEAYYIMVTG